MWIPQMQCKESSGITMAQRIDLNSQFSILNSREISVIINSQNPAEVKEERKKDSIYKINNKFHGLSPPGGLVSPSGGFASLAFD